MVGTRRRSRTTLVVAGVLVVGTVGACGGADPGTGLAGALASVPDTPETATWFTYSDVSAAHELGAYDDLEHPLRFAGDVGLGRWGTFRPEVSALVPEGTSAGASALSTGQPPDERVRFTGLEAGAVEEFFDGTEGERSDVAGGTLLVRLPDHEVVLESGALPASLVGANSLWYDDTTLVASSTRAGTLALVEPPGRSLAEAEVYAGVTDCLGDVVGAVLVSGETLARPAEALGIGMAWDDDGEPVGRAVETLCVRTAADPASEADRIAAGMSDYPGLEDLVDWSDVRADASGDWARVSVRPTRGAFVLYQMLVRRDLERVLGGVD